MKNAGLKVMVDLNRCQGYGQCCFAAPTVFRLHGEEALEYDPGPDDSARLQVMRAAKACPVQAISLGWPPEHVEKPGGRRRAGRGRRMVIVGASLAGFRAAEALRSEGFKGSLTLIGDEPYFPYDRPPLSREVLAGRLPVDHTTLGKLNDLKADWRLGTRATGLDVAGRRVQLETGEEVGFDRLLIATGARARPWPDPGEGALDGVFLLRSRDDASGLRERLAARPRRVLVVGAGIMGCEIAAACREIDLPVTMTERGPAPLLRVLGSTIGAAVTDLQRLNGVDLRTRTTVARLEGDQNGRVRRVTLSDGSVLEVDVVVAAMGVVRNTEWLRDSGLAADERGVVVDQYCRALTRDGAPAEGIFAAGDVARWPHPLYEGRLLAIEHWGNAVTQGETAGHNMGVEPLAFRAHNYIPAFWSRQFGVSIKCFGLPDAADEVIVTQGSPAEGAFAAAYGRRGRIVAAVTFNKNRWLSFYQDLIEAAGPFLTHLQAADQPPAQRPQPAGFATTH